jgi:predicted small secreted protein
MTMKKIISVYIIFAFLLMSFAGCGKRIVDSFGLDIPVVSQKISDVAEKLDKLNEVLLKNVESSEAREATSMAVVVNSLNSNISALNTKIDALNKNTVIGNEKTDSVIKNLKEFSITLGNGTTNGTTIYLGQQKPDPSKLRDASAFAGIANFALNIFKVYKG